MQHISNEVRKVLNKLMMHKHRKQSLEQTRKGTTICQSIENQCQAEVQANPSAGALELIE